MRFAKLTPVCTLGSLVLAIACATTHPAPNGEMIQLPVFRVPVPANPDSAWAVATADRILSGGDSTKHFELLSLCTQKNGYLVDMTPTLPRHPTESPPAVQLGGGGIVFISTAGSAVILVSYQ